MISICPKSHDGWLLGQKMPELILCLLLYISRSERGHCSRSCGRVEVKVSGLGRTRSYMGDVHIGPPEKREMAHILQSQLNYSSHQLVRVNCSCKSRAPSCWRTKPNIRSNLVRVWIGNKLIEFMCTSIRWDTEEKQGTKWWGNGLQDAQVMGPHIIVMPPSQPDCFAAANGKAFSPNTKLALIPYSV